jgi:hypothetical protein
MDGGVAVVPGASRGARFGDRLASSDAVARRILDGGGHVVLGRITPFESSPQWGNLVTAYRTPGGAPGTWSLRSYAICAAET